MAATTKDAAPKAEAPKAEPAKVEAPAERFVAQMPTTNPEPDHYLGARDCCGNCPGWKQAFNSPFGQCLPAIRWLGGPLYTPDLANCSLDPATKAKGISR